MKKTVFTGLIAALAAIAMPGESRAAYTITISDGISAPVVFAGGPNGASGNQTYFYSSVADGFGAMTVAGLGFGPGAPGTGTSLLLTQFSGSITFAGSITAKTVTISLDTDGYVMNVNHGTVDTSFASTVLVGTATGTSTVAGVNVPGSAINLAFNPGPNSIGGDTFTTVNFGANPVTFGNRMVLNLNGGGTGVTASMTLTSQFVAAPAPPALLLAAFGIPAMGLVRRWTRKVKSTEEMAVAA
jgi:hypothetical protein